MNQRKKEREKAFIHLWKKFFVCVCIYREGGIGIGIGMSR